MKVASGALVVDILVVNPDVKAKRDVVEIRALTIVVEIVVVWVVVDGVRVSFYVAKNIVKIKNI